MKKGRSPRRRLTTSGLSRLAWLASCRGSAGRDALSVLQDALIVKYPSQFEDAIERADAWGERRGKNHSEYVVMFVASMARRLEKTPAYRTMPLMAQWPFSVSNLSEAVASPWRRGVVIVYGSRDGFNVHHWAEAKQRFPREWTR